MRPWTPACLQESLDDTPFMAHALAVIARARLGGGAPADNLHRVQAALDALARACGQQALRIGIMSYEEYFAEVRSMARALDRRDSLPAAVPTMWLSDGETLTQYLSDPAKLADLLAWNSASENLFFPPDAA